MIDIVLDMTRVNPGSLASKDASNPIGCAMGEVLFQAGVPLDVLRQNASTDTVLQDLKWATLLGDFLGVTPQKAKKLWVVFKEIQKAYDQYTRKIKDTGYKPTTKRGKTVAGSRIKMLGETININFILDWDGSIGQKISHCPFTGFDMKSLPPLPKESSSETKKVQSTV